MSGSLAHCPSCGTASSGGAFCGGCGALIGARECAACGRPVAAGSRFCAGCGAPVTAGRGVPAGGAAEAAGGPSRTAMLVGAAIVGTALVAVLLVLARDPAARGAPVVVGPVGPSGVTTGAAPAPPDLSQMTPRERFDRLYNRIMTAAEQGDQQTVETFTPMAVMAYQQLPEVDADARYHLALLRLHTGDSPGALALADTILAETPTHLFGFLIRSTAATFGGDAAARATAEQAYRTNYEPELAAGRPEYEHHRRMLDEFATRAGGS